MEWEDDKDISSFAGRNANCELNKYNHVVLYQVVLSSDSTPLTVIGMVHGKWHKMPNYFELLMVANLEIDIQLVHLPD